MMSSPPEAEKSKESDPPAAEQTGFCEEEEEEEYIGEDDNYLLDLGFGYESEDEDCITPTVMKENAVKKCDEEFHIVIPSLENISSDNPIELDQIQYDKFSITPRFEVSSAQEGNVYFSLICHKAFYMDASLYIPKLDKVVYNRLCSFSKGVNSATLDPHVFAASEIPSEPLDATLSFHYFPNENYSRQYFNCVGLVNSGMTCYLNSLLQCLFHLKIFRQNVFNISKETKSNIALAMRVLFTRMQIAYKPVSTRDLTKAFGWETNEYLFEQHDVQELTRLLLDRLDDFTDGNASSIFKGKFEVTITTSSTKDSHVETFCDLSLQVNGIPNLEESIKKFFEPDILSGENQYKLPDGTMTDAEVKYVVTENPVVLSIHLRRFEYSDDKMKKVLSRFEYPETLIFNGDEYELISIISHYGSVYGGHYNAYANVDGIWTKFDDERVCHCEKFEVFQQNFGTEAKNTFTAYVLFYIKIGGNNIPDPEVPSEIVEEEKKRISQLTMHIYTGYFEEKVIKVNKNLNSEQFVEFLSQETKIPIEKLVVKKIVDSEISIVPEPVPNTTDTYFIDDSSLMVVWVRFWVPDYDIVKIGPFHVEDGETVEQLGKKVLEFLHLSDDIKLKSFIFVNEKSDGILAEGIIQQSCMMSYEFDEEFRTEENIKKFIESVSKITTPVEAPKPEYESHLTLLKDEISINSINDYINYVLNYESILFKQALTPDDETLSFTLDISRSLTYDQLVQCVARKLNINQNHLLLFQPARDYLGADPVPYNRDLFNNVSNIIDLTDILYYDILEEDMRFANRSDVIVIDEKGNPKDHFPIVLCRGEQQTLKALREAITKKLSTRIDSYNSSNENNDAKETENTNENNGNNDETDTPKYQSDKFFLFYVKDSAPVFMSDDENAEVLFNLRVFCQLGDYDMSKLKLRIIRTTYQFITPSMVQYLPYVIFVDQGTTWKDVKEHFSNETIILLHLKKIHFDCVDEDDNRVMTEDDYIGLTYTQTFDLRFNFNKAMTINKEIDQLVASDNKEEEEEYDEEEDEGIEPDTNDENKSPEA